MVDENPYEAPSTDLQVADEVGDPQSVAFGRGASWIGEGFGYFKQAPLAWIIILVLMMGLQLGLAIIPIIGPIAGYIIWPVMMGGIMLGCAVLDDGDELSVSHLFAGFSSENRGPLIALGAVYLLMMLAVIAVMAIMVAVGGFGLAGMAQLSGDELANMDTAAAGGILLIVLIAMGLFVPIMMFMWFAPALIMLGNKPVFESMKLSFIGCLKNIMPFLLYGVVGLILFVVAIIPLGLGLIIVVPMFMASIYASYRDIYSQ